MSIRPLDEIEAENAVCVMRLLEEQAKRQPLTIARNAQLTRLRAFWWHHYVENCNTLTSKKRSKLLGDIRKALMEVGVDRDKLSAVLTDKEVASQWLFLSLEVAREILYDHIKRFRDSDESDSDLTKNLLEMCGLPSTLDMVRIIHDDVGLKLVESRESTFCYNQMLTYFCSRRAPEALKEWVEHGETDKKMPSLPDPVTDPEGCRNFFQSSIFNRENHAAENAWNNVRKERYSEDRVDMYEALRECMGDEGLIQMSHRPFIKSTGPPGVTFLGRLLMEIVELLKVRRSRERPVQIVAQRDEFVMKLVSRLPGLVILLEKLHCVLRKKRIRPDFKFRKHLSVGAFYDLSALSDRAKSTLRAVIDDASHGGSDVEEDAHATSVVDLTERVQALSTN